MVKNNSLNRLKTLFSVVLFIMAAVAFVQLLPVTVNAATVPHYTLSEDGGTWDGTQYRLPDGTLAKDAFFCDGSYTYYLQYDGTPMKDRLTYHPDGEHVIYFDKDGHEVFSDFSNITISISGDIVDDMCFFDVNGYMYVDTLTYDKTGTKLYYVNPYGVLERNGWFSFSGNEFDAGLGFSGISGGYGYANSDCSLMVNTTTYDWNGNLVFLLGDGHVEGSQTGKSQSTNTDSGTGNNPVCNLPSWSSYYKYEYAYKSKDLSGLSEADMPFYEGLKEYLDYAYQFNTPYLQEKAVHDYMVLHCVYDHENVANNTIPWESYSPEGVMVNKIAVCAGYSKAFKLIMDILGIECEVIKSRELDHDWNRVKLDGDWYMLDVTFDVGYSDAYLDEEYISHAFFNLPSKFFGKHEADDYTETAEGTKYIGVADKIYYVKADDSATQICEILDTEVKLMENIRSFCILVEDSMLRDELNNILFSEEYEEYMKPYYWEVNEATDGSDSFLVFFDIDRF